MTKKSIVIVLTFLILAGCGGDMKNNSNLINGIFKSCPSSPNCVSSMEEGKKYIQPLRYSVERNKALATITQVVSTLPGASLVEEQGGYLHYTVKSRVFGFIDDLEIYLPEGEQTVHLRSASRVGYSDFGVNRNRLEKVEKMLQETQLFQ